MAATVKQLDIILALAREGRRAARLAPPRAGEGDETETHTWLDEVDPEDDDDEDDLDDDDDWDDDDDDLDDDDDEDDEDDDDDLDDDDY